MQWPTQAGIITTNLKVKIDFTLPGISATKIVTWYFHVDDSAKCRYYMILGRYLLIDLVLNLEFSDPVNEAYDGYFKGSTAPIVDLDMYEYKYLSTGGNIPEE